MGKGASGQLLREHTQNCFLVCSFRASASVTCSYATSPAESRSREIVPQAPMECAQQAETRSRRITSTAVEGKGWVLKQRLHDVQSRVGATATRAHVESALSTKLFADSCSVRHQGNCCASTREIPATWISIRAQGTERCSCDKTAALAHHKHTWISLRAQRDMFRRKDCCVLTPGAHFDLFPCANRHVPAKRLLRSHAASTLGSRSVRKGTCPIEKTAAFSRCEHTWIFLRAQARRHAKRLLPSHAASTVGSRSMHKKMHSIEKIADLALPPR